MYRISRLYANCEFSLCVELIIDMMYIVGTTGVSHNFINLKI